MAEFVDFHDPRYQDALDRLQEQCEAFIDAREGMSDPTFLVGTITASCAAIYNLNPPAGLMHPSGLFRTK